VRCRRRTARHISSSNVKKASQERGAFTVHKAPHRTRRSQRRVFIGHLATVGLLHYERRFQSRSAFLSWMGSIPRRDAEQVAEDVFHGKIVNIPILYLEEQVQYLLAEGFAPVVSE
jgi:hypothetical protein